jgi:hypothetical protein
LQPELVQQDPNFWFVCEGETLCAKNGEGILVGDELFSEKCCRSPRGRLLYRSIGWRRVVVAVVPWPMGSQSSFAAVSQV